MATDLAAPPAFAPPGIDPVTGEIYAPQGAHDAVGGSLLESATHTVVAYPECGEAVYQIRPATRENAPRLAGLDPLKIAEKAAKKAARGNALGRERAAAESARRARTSIRRWCIANTADHQLTLTLDEEHATHSADDLWKMCESFRRVLDAAGFDQVLLVPEPHPGGHGFHVHGALPGYIPIKLLREAWPFGFVWVTGPQKFRRHQESKRAACRRIGNYLGEYLGKDLDRAGAEEASGAATPSLPTVGFNRKRYSCSRGTQPIAERASFIAPTAARVWIDRVLGGPCDIVWSSEDRDDWEGPPTAVLVRRE